MAQSYVVTVREISEREVFIPAAEDEEQAVRLVQQGQGRRTTTAHRAKELAPKYWAVRPANEEEAQPSMGYAGGEAGSHEQRRIQELEAELHRLRRGEEHPGNAEGTGPAGMVEVQGGGLRPVEQTIPGKGPGTHKSKPLSPEQPVEIEEGDILPRKHTTT